VYVGNDFNDVGPTGKKANKGESLRDRIIDEGYEKSALQGQLDLQTKGRGAGWGGFL